MERINSGNVLELWASQYKCVQRWLAKIQRKKDAAFDLYRLCLWSEKDPDQLLALKDNPASREAELLLDDFKLVDQYTPSVRRRILINTKSFFRGNYRPVSPKAGVIEDYTKVTPYHKIDKPMLYKLWRACFNPRDRFLVSLFFSSGIARGSIPHLTWGHLEDDWESKRIVHISLEPEIIKGHGRGKYKGVRQETFLVPSAKRDLLEYKEWIEQRLGRSVTKKDPLVFTTTTPYQGISYDEITNIFRQLKKRTGLEVTPHDARRYVENALENAGIHVNRCRKIRGRKVRGEEAPYSQPAIEELRADFAKALEDLEFQVEKPTITREEVRREIFSTISEEDKKRAAENLGVSVQELESKFYLREIEFGDILERARIGKRNSADCQRIVAEEDLERFLNEGWKVQHVLASGRIIIEK